MKELELVVVAWGVVALTSCGWFNRGVRWAGDPEAVVQGLDLGLDGGVLVDETTFCMPARADGAVGRPQALACVDLVARTGWVGEAVPGDRGVVLSAGMLPREPAVGRVAWAWWTEDDRLVLGLLDREGRWVRPPETVAPPRNGLAVRLLGMRWRGDGEVEAVYERVNEGAFRWPGDEAQVEAEVPWRIAAASWTDETWRIHETQVDGTTRWRTVKGEEEAGPDLDGLASRLGEVANPEAGVLVQGWRQHAVRGGQLVPVAACPDGSEPLQGTYRFAGGGLAWIPRCPGSGEDRYGIDGAWVTAGPDERAVPVGDRVVRITDGFELR